MSLFKKICEPWQTIRNRSNHSTTAKRCHMDTCNCTNCHKLPEFAECAVCMNSLQGTKIRSCSVCANLVCEDCASKLTKCAFCRTEKPLERNRAVERFFENLHLPCKNVRSGCKILVTTESRSVHERFCHLSSYECILNKTCRWSGPIMSMPSHFQEAHNLVITNCNLTTINIDQFHQKALSETETVYMGCLKCYNQLFYYKLTVYKEELKISVSRLGYLRGVALKEAQRIFKMFVMIVGSNGVEESGWCSLESTSCHKYTSTETFCSTFYKEDLADNEKDFTQVSLYIKKSKKRSKKIHAVNIDTDS